MSEGLISLIKFYKNLPDDLFLEMQLTVEKHSLYGTGIIPYEPNNNAHKMMERKYSSIGYLVADTVEELCIPTENRYPTLSKHILHLASRYEQFVSALSVHRFVCHTNIQAKQFRDILTEDIVVVDDWYYVQTTDGRMFPSTIHGKSVDEIYFVPEFDFDVWDRFGLKRRGQKPAMIYNTETRKFAFSDMRSINRAFVPLPVQTYEGAIDILEEGCLSKFRLTPYKNEFRLDLVS